jgi:two-component system chemotaxis response regulator CheB
MEVKRGRISFNNDASAGVYQPSENVLFSSVAREYGRGCVGVILSGMGADGADGMKVLHETGGFTIAQEAV